MEQKLIEMLEDARNVSDKKVALKAKYGIQSNKAGEVEYEILTRAMELRKKVECSDISLRIFDKFWNYPESPAKLRQAFANESTEFVLYYRKNLERYLATRKSHYGPRTEAKIRVLNTILCERAKENNENLQAVLAKLNEETKEFHETFVNNMVEREMKRFNYFAQFKGLRVYVHDKYIGNWKYVKEVVVSASNQVTPPENLNVHWVNAFHFIEVKSKNFNAEAYKEYVREDAEREFNNNIRLVAERCESKGLTAESLKVLWANENDAKAFKMIIEGNGIKVYCRSIFCAEDSVLVSAHWRFIITNQK